MNRPPEFAEQYSAAERIRFLVGGAVAGALLIGVAKLWFFPWLSEFSASAQCRTVFGSNGAAVLFYGLFAGVPFSAGLVVAFTAGRRGFCDNSKTACSRRHFAIADRTNIALELHETSTWGAAANV